MSGEQSALFLRYARGRIAYFWMRQVLVCIGAVSLGYMVSPLVGFIAGAIAFAGDAIDCVHLHFLRKRICDNSRLREVGVAAATTAGLQAVSVSICTWFAWFLPDGGGGHQFATVFLMSAALNAGLVWPYHPQSALVRLCVYAMTACSGSLIHLVRHPDRADQTLIELLSMILTVYTVVILLKFVVKSHARLTNKSNELQATIDALDISNVQVQRTQSQARQLSLVAKHANDSVVITGADRKITWVNDAFTKITGYASDDVVGRAPSDVLNGPETDKETVQRISNSVARGKPIRTEILNYDKSGAPIWMEINLVPVKSDSGVIETVVAIERDISKLKKHEQELADAMLAAERGEKAKAEFLATMSHEIRTPMNAIIGLSDLLTECDLDAESGQYAITIRDSAYSLLSIINDVLDYSKLDSGQMTIDPVSFDLRDCISGTVNMLLAQATKKGLYLDVIEDHALPDRVVGDDARLRQILVNLIGNAIKFTEVGGVTLAPSVLRKDDKMLFSVSIKDTGIGIPEDRLNHVFDKFAQADGKTTRKYGGTGLGLSISRLLARRMGGDIVLQSKLGEGSVFTLTIELTKSRSNATPGPKIQENIRCDIEPMSVLVAEDNATNRFLIAKFLKETPVDLSFAHNGVEAVAHLQNKRPDVIFMDMSMPEMDGLEATQAIRALDGPQPHIIALTANAFSSDRAACFDAGMDDFLAKPVKKSDLLAKLATRNAGMSVKPL